MSAAASIAVHLSHRGFAVRLVTAAGEDPSQRLALPRRRPQHRPAARGAGRASQPTQRAQLDTGWLTEHGGGGLVVAVVGGVEPHDLPVLRRMQHHAGSALASPSTSTPGSSAPAGTGGAAAAADPAGLAGGRRCGPRDRLEAVWQELGRGRTQSARSRGGAAPSGPSVTMTRRRSAW